VDRSRPRLRRFMFAVCAPLGSFLYSSPAGAQLLSPPRKRWEAVSQMRRAPEGRHYYGLWILWHRHSCLCCRERTSIMRTPFSRTARCPLISLSSLGEPAGAGPEFARVGEPRASRKDDSGDIFQAVQCVLTSSLITPTTSSRLIILMGFSPALSASALSKVEERHLGP
jgi:hypothetical protein